MALDAIIANKRLELSRRKASRPIEEVRAVKARPVRSLAAALARGRARFILECKKASPSRGVIRGDYDAAAIAAGLAAHADAISVLADERFFGGRPRDVSAVSGAVACPVLMKDFTIDPYQVHEARALGADAVLLIMAAADDPTSRSILDAAEESGMDVLVEVHDEGELGRALNLGARIIGINSRDLRTLDVDLGTVERLAPLVPEDRILVAESGVRSHSDTRRLAGKADAFLVGTSLMESDEPVRAAREIIFGRVKVCGLTSPEDARAAERAGATYGGLIFVKESPRSIGIGRAREIAAASKLHLVGVFADEAAPQVASVAKELGLRAVQLHGDETPGYIGRIREMLPSGCEVWKALRVRDEMPRLEEAAADRVLLDTYSADAKGGTGRAFDWSILEGRDLSRVIVSGGLCPSNAAAADGLGAFALDVNSGVESAPGRKDRSLLDEFFSRLRGDGRRRGDEI